MAAGKAGMLPGSLFNREKMEGYGICTMET